MNRKTAAIRSRFYRLAVSGYRQRPGCWFTARTDVIEPRQDRAQPPVRDCETRRVGLSGAVANRALHTIVLHRRQHDPATRDYIAQRIADGKTRRDATHLLKRYLARHLYRQLQQAEPLMTSQVIEASFPNTRAGEHVSFGDPARDRST
jgi:hypothetical protein